jgi:hypothetical protein
LTTSNSTTAGSVVEAGGVVVVVVTGGVEVVGGVEVATVPESPPQAERKGTERSTATRTATVIIPEHNLKRINIPP